MNPLPAPPLESRVQDNLQAQADCARQLLGVLAEERSALIAGDVARLEQLTQQKAQAAGLLQNLGSTLLRLRGNARVGIDAWLARLPAALLVQWRELLQLAEQCRQANDDNAMLLATREAQLRNTLRALRPSGTAEIYGRRGRFDLGLPGRSFGSA